MNVDFERLKGVCIHSNGKWCGEERGACTEATCILGAPLIGESPAKAQNSAMPKLPPFEDIWNNLRAEIVNPASILGDTEYLIKGQAKTVYKFVERQLSGG